VAPTPASRLGYLDWARGLCVLFMLHTHAFYAWVRPEDRDTAYFGYTRLVGGFPGAVFLFLAGLVLSLANESRVARGAAPRDAVRHGLARGLEILGFAFLFRLWMWMSGDFGRAADLLRVDILNCIGASVTLAAGLTLGWPTVGRRVAAALTLGLAIPLLTPVLWDSPWVRRYLPVGLAGYVDGRLPDSFFPLFPWGGFTALGVAAGSLLHGARRAGREGMLLAAMAGLGAALLPAGRLLDPLLAGAYPRYDFWHTSPAYFLIKTGVVLLVMGLAYAADRIPGPSPLRQMGTTSLLIYWVHLEIVYGKYVAPWARGSLDLRQATAGVALLTLAMLALSILRTHASRRRLSRREALAKA
jgi:uncharacterized membrane protein